MLLSEDKPREGRVVYFSSEWRSCILRVSSSLLRSGAARWHTLGYFLKEGVLAFLSHSSPLMGSNLQDCIGHSKNMEGLCPAALFQGREITFQYQPFFTPRLPAVYEILHDWRPVNDLSTKTSIFRDYPTSGSRVPFFAITIL